MAKITSMSVAPGSQFAYTVKDGQIYMLIGNAWEKVPPPREAIPGVDAIDLSGDTLWAACPNGEVYSTENNGETWVQRGKTWDYYKSPPLSKEASPDR